MKCGLCVLLVTIKTRNMSHADLVLRNLLDNIAEEQNYNNHELKVEPISSGGANYTSQLYLATLSSKGKEDLHLFAKVASTGENMRSQAPMKIYDTERLVYTKLLKVYERLQDQHNIAAEHRLLMPKFYGCNPNLYEETIVLEDMTKRGFTSYNRFEAVDWEYACIAVTEMARLHALSIAFKIEQPEEFTEVAENTKFTWSNDDVEKKLYWERVITAAIAVTKEEYRERVQKHYSNQDPNGIQNFLKPFHQEVLLHGDYKPSNLLHRKRENGRLEITVVDYQAVQAGTPAMDLLYFIVSGSDSKFRAQYYDQLLDHYYSQLSAAMERLALQPQQLYSRDDFYAEWKAKLPFVLNVAAFTLPMVTVEVQNTLKISDDEGIAGFAVHNTSELFSERFNGIVEDCYKWGII